MPELEPLDLHCQMVIKAFSDGRVVPCLGAGVNLCDRPDGLKWQRGQRQYLPSGSELAGHLADEFYYPQQDVHDLVRVAQYVAAVQGSGPLYSTLHSLLDADYPLTPVHRFLAGLPAALSAKGYTSQHLLIVSTNYDDLMERAFETAGEPFEVVSYLAEGEQRGKFVHWLPGRDPILIEKPNEYQGLSLGQRSLLLKIHGAVDRATSEWDSFVITEDHYIDYLSRADVSTLMPATLVAKLKRSHFLFLGYSLRDWNLRVILHRIWGEQKLRWNSWAIQLDPDPLEERFWQRRGVDLLAVRLEGYLEALARCLETLPRAGGAE
jgi:hypothetical protein